MSAAVKVPMSPPTLLAHRSTWSFQALNYVIVALRDNLGRPISSAALSQLLPNYLRVVGLLDPRSGVGCVLDYPALDSIARAASSVAALVASAVAVAVTDVSRWTSFSSHVAGSG